MNRPFPNLVIPRRDANPVPGNAHATCAALREPDSLSEFVHDLRQPLEVIEYLAYYLQMLSHDDPTTQHLQTIRTMVVRANQILERVA